MDLERVIADGEQFVKNAEDEMQRKILREDQLYFIENQVEAIDVYLADTEEFQDGNPELTALREKLRGLKTQLERKSMSFLAEQEGTDLPEEAPPEETAKDLVGYGKEFIELADNALKQEITSIEHVNQWEDPLTMINSYLADSEAFVQHDADLVKIREDLRSRKQELQKRIEDLVSEWRAADIAEAD